MVTFTVVPDKRKGSRGLICPRGCVSLTAGVAQLVEHLICYQRDRGSNPFASSRIEFCGRQRICAARRLREFFPTALHKEAVPSVCACEQKSCAHRISILVCLSQCRLWREGVRPIISAQVGEWLKPTDCKSVPPSEVRRFESFPVHQE